KGPFCFYRIEWGLLSLWYFSNFLKGYKPALCCGETRYAPELFNQLKQFPFIRSHSSFLFFQTEAQKERFLLERKTVAYDSPQYHQLLGETLGYPPQAIDFYIQIVHLQTQTSQRLMNKKIFL